MAMRSFYNEIKGMKVKELPAHLKPIPAPSILSITSASAELSSHTSSPSLRSAATSSTSSTPKNTAAIDPMPFKLALQVTGIWCINLGKHKNTNRHQVFCASIRRISSKGRLLQTNRSVNFSEL
ncbi:hypothetical protein Pfo_019824 [Paulownia fortunei]|nr:hypothetical protein Pfo_019824 [Paulownia fortunei]